ncbi:MAG: NUDIX domain-containing protein [Lentisphaeria bacterium]|nr:NUDIX domain-containing protein [Lentisphaeria bacterium]
MRLIRKYLHDDAKELANKSIFTRTAARAIVIDGEDLLLLYTKRYDDYSFPGGGVDPGEDITMGMIRELKEETGAKNIEVIAEFGIYEEIKPFWKNEYDLIHMTSHFYICDILKELGASNLEDYEIKNGMEAKWVNIYEAINHNRAVIKAQPESIGIYIDRELYMLEVVAKEIIERQSV